MKHRLTCIDYDKVLLLIVPNLPYSREQHTRNGVLLRYQ